MSETLTLIVQNGDIGTAENVNGELLLNQATTNQFKLIYGSKQDGTFKSRRWGTKTFLDLCFVSEDQDGLPLSVKSVIKYKFQ